MIPKGQKRAKKGQIKSWGQTLAKRARKGPEIAQGPDQNSPGQELSKRARFGNFWPLKGPSGNVDDLFLSVLYGATKLS